MAIDESEPKPDVHRDPPSPSEPRGDVPSERPEVRLHLPTKPAVELHEPAKKKHWYEHDLPLFKDIALPVLTALIAVLVLVHDCRTEQREFEIRQQEAAIKQQEATSAQRDLRARVFAELLETDDNKRAVSIMRLAQEGGEIMPAVKLALGVQQTRVRQGATEVVFQILQSETVPRNSLIDILVDYYSSNNTLLRLGVLEFFVKAERNLLEDEVRRIFQLITRHLTSRSPGCNSADANLVLETARFLGIWPFVESKNLLLTLASICGNDRLYDGARGQVIYGLERIGLELPNADREDIVRALDNMEKTATPDVALRISDARKSIRRAQQTR